MKRIPKIIDGIEYWKCFRCKQDKPTDKFYPRSDNGRPMSYCIQCDTEKHTADYQAGTKYLTTQRASAKNWNRRLRAKVMEFLGGKCVKCGFDDIRALQVDHVNSDGAADRISVKNAAYVIYKKVLDGATGYQLLCANCNWIKRWENNEVTGRKKKYETSSPEVLVA